MWKYIATSILFLFNSEIVSLIALLMMVYMFLYQVLIARSTCHNQ